jgi:UDP:flavonoid glycosyltransferase YjiC (YdhE family)
MRVLFTTWPLSGHYFPMVPLAWALRAADHEVLMAGQPDLLPAMRASGLPCTAVGRRLDVTAAHREAWDLVRDREPDGSPAGGAEPISDHLTGYLGNADLVPAHGTLRRLERETVQMFRARWMRRAAAGEPRLSLYGEVAEATVGDLLALARSWRPDLIVYDALTFAGPLVATVIGVPAVRSLFGPDVTSFAKTIGLAPVLERFGLDDLDLLGTATIDPCPRSLQLPDAVVPTRRLRVRYIPYNGLAEVPGWLWEESAASPRERICLTWGTSIHRIFGERAFLPGDTLQACAKLAADRDAELVLAITAGQRSLIPDPPANVRVVESVPLNALLPTCQALIHQGGAGTMLTAVHHGLPQLVLPQVVDQAANAFMLTASGAGRTHAAVGLNASDLIATAHDLLDDPTHRAAAHRLRREMHHQPTPADVVDDLAVLV